MEVRDFPFQLTDYMGRHPKAVGDDADLHAAFGQRTDDLRPVGTHERLSSDHGDAAAPHIGKLTRHIQTLDGRQLVFTRLSAA